MVRFLVGVTFLCALTAPFAAAGGWVLAQALLAALPGAGGS